MERYSHSALKQFGTCRRQFHETRILELWPREETAQTVYGTALHKAAEDFINDGVCVPVEFRTMTPVLNSLMAMKGVKHSEMELAVTMGLAPCAFNAPDAWMRGICDVVILNGTTARVLDWKSGSNKYPDVSQLTLMALLLFAHYPHVEEVKSALVFVKHGAMVKHSTLRAQSKTLWAGIRMDVAIVERCHELNDWRPHPSGLCAKYCVVRSCEHNGRN